jgi:hypothetical protein
LDLSGGDAMPGDMSDVVFVPIEFRLLGQSLVYTV